MITYKGRLPLTIGESWYTNDLGGGRADIVHFYHLSEPPATGQFEEFITIWIDLTLPEEAIFQAMSTTTRRYIRRAAEYELRYGSWFEDSVDQLAAFAAFFDAFAAVKQLDCADRKWLRNHAVSGALDLSCVSDARGNPLVWHAHYRDSGHVRLRYSASAPRDRTDRDLGTLIGRANRYHHWEDMKRFQRSGVVLYDFGGWYPGAENKELLAINRFKEDFGGEIVKTFHCTRALTWRGRCYLAASRAWNRWAAFRRRD